MSRWRVGGVPYLNAKPLLRGLDADPRVRLVLETPARLGPLLARGALDAATMPAFEILRHRWELVPGWCISSRGRVETVVLHLKKPLRSLRTVALDRDSRTSNALLRILLESRWGLRPRYVKHDPRSDAFLRDRRVDAALTIGDPAFADRGVPVLDLGAAWHAWTGVPFVYAAWARRRRLPALEERLRRAATEGMESLLQIAMEEHERVGLTVAECVEYLSRNIRYVLGPEEHVGLKLFARHARRLRLL